MYLSIVRDLGRLKKENAKLKTENLALKGSRFLTNCKYKYYKLEIGLKLYILTQLKKILMEHLNKPQLSKSNGIKTPLYERGKK